MPTRYRLTAHPYSPAAVPEVGHAFEPGDPFGCILTERALSTEEMRAFDLHEQPVAWDRPEPGQRRLDQVLGVLEWQADHTARVVEALPYVPAAWTDVGPLRRAAWLRLAPDTEANRALFGERYWGWEERDG